MIASSGISRFVLLAGIGWVLLVIGLLALERWTGIQTTACLFKRATGVPCPTCGSTRAMEALLGGHIGAAISLNPLVTCLAFLTPIAIGLWIAASRRGHGASHRVRPTAATWNAVVAIGLVALVLNWIWVIRRGN